MIARVRLPPDTILQAGESPVGYLKGVRAHRLNGRLLLVGVVHVSYRYRRFGVREVVDGTAVRGSRTATRQSA